MGEQNKGVRKALKRDSERFKLLFTNSRPVLPEGYSAPLSTRTTCELIADEMARAE